MSSPLLWFGTAAKLMKSALKIPGSTSGTFTLQTPAAVTDYTVTFPAAQGAAATALVNDGSGNLSWTSPVTGAQITSSTSDDANFTQSAAFGTISLKSIYTSRVGDRLVGRGYFKSGTIAASTPSITMGYTVDTAKIPSTNNITKVGYWKRITSGGSPTDAFAANASGVLFIDTSAPTVLQFAANTVNNIWGSTGNANNFFNTTDGVYFEFELPVSGWSATAVAISSVSARYYASATSISGSLATINWTTKDYDTNNAMSSGTYTVPTASPGKYQINAGLLITGTIALNNTLIMEIQKNGTVVSRSTQYLASTLTDAKVTISDIINCAAGDTIRIQVSTSATGPSIVSSNFDNYISLALIGN